MAYCPVAEYFRVQAVAAYSFVAGRSAHFRKAGAYFFKICRGQCSTGAAFDRFAPFKNNLLQFLREALIRYAKAAFKEFYNGSREAERIAFGVNVFFGKVVLHHKQCHIANHFGRRRYFNNIAEHHGNAVVHIFNVFPAFAEAYCFSLLLQVAVLAARHFVDVNFRVGVRNGVVDCFIIRTHAFPVTGHFVKCVNVKVRLARMTGKCVVQACAARLGSAAAHSAHGYVNNIYAGVDSAGVSVNAVAAAFVRMQVDRHVNGFFKGRNKLVSCFRLQKACHILNADGVGTGFFQFFRHGYIIFKVVFITARV